MKPEDHEHLTIIFKKIFDVLSSIYTDRWEMTARNLIIALINETDSILNKYSNSLLSFSKGERSIINKFKSLAKDNFAQQKPISFYIKKLNVSASQFYKIFKNENEKSPSSYLNNLLLSEAKFLLSNSELNIGEIAFKLAFSDIYAFSKYFKKHTTHSPSAFRQLKLAGNK
ncbi:HTH-type transcriptional activator RhaS [compost metagenome]